MGEATGRVSENLRGQLSNSLVRVSVSLRQESSSQPNDRDRCVAGEGTGTAADVVAAAILVVSHVTDMPVFDFPVTTSYIENLGRASA